MPMIIDQAGLGAGVPGRARRDGLLTGALVKLTDNVPGGTTEFEVLYQPPGDTTTQASLAPTLGNGHVWTFTPTATVSGPWRVRLRHTGVDGSVVEEVRIFGIPDALGNVPPAPGERADSNASVSSATSIDVISRCERNWPTLDYPAGNPFGWLADLIAAGGGGGGGGGALTVVNKLYSSAPFVVTANSHTIFGGGETPGVANDVAATLPAAVTPGDVCRVTTVTDSCSRVNLIPNGTDLIIWDGSGPANSPLPLEGSKDVTLVCAVAGRWFVLDADRSPQQKPSIAFACDYYPTTFTSAAFTFSTGGSAATDTLTAVALGSVTVDGMDLGFLSGIDLLVYRTVLISPDSGGATPPSWGGLWVLRDPGSVGTPAVLQRSTRTAYQSQLFPSVGPVLVIGGIRYPMTSWIVVGQVGVQTQALPVDTLLQGQSGSVVGQDGSDTGMRGGYGADAVGANGARGGGANCVGGQGGSSDTQNGDGGYAFVDGGPPGAGAGAAGRGGHVRIGSFNADAILSGYAPPGVPWQHQGGFSTVPAAQVSGAAVDLDCQVSNHLDVALTANTTATFTHQTPGQQGTILVTQTGAFTMTISGSVLYPAGVAPTFVGVGTYLLSWYRHGGPPPNLYVWPVPSIGIRFA